MLQRYATFVSQLASSKAYSNLCNIVMIFSARCNIYISRLCYDVSVCLFVCDGSALAHYS